jgi:two-component system nitrogen regulation response regulator GlnG
LRERLEDLPLLVEHFLRKFSRELGKEPVRSAPEVLALLGQYAWPGNLRELQSVLKQALLHTTGPVLVPDFLPSLQAGEGKEKPATRELDPFLADRLRAGSRDLYAEALARMERQLLKAVLDHTGGNQLQAAKILGITRGSLRTKIRALGIIIERSVTTDEDQKD